MWQAAESTTAAATRADTTASIPSMWAKIANVRYEENALRRGKAETGARVLNPVTNIFVGENSVFTLDTAQIKGC